jgi:hypothetical protein
MFWKQKKKKQNKTMFLVEVISYNVNMISPNQLGVKPAFE